MKIFVGGRKRRIIVQAPSSGGEVAENRIGLDVRETAHRASDRVSAVAAVAEPNRRANETVIAGLLTQVNETSRRANETVAGVATAQVAESGRRAVDAVGMIAAVADSARRASESVAARIVVTETARRASATETANIVATAVEASRKAVESVTAVVAAAINTAKRAAGSSTVNVTLAGYANANVSTTGWVNPANALGNTTATNATLTATATGIAGSTSATTNGAMVLGFADPLLSDLTIQTATLNVERAVVSSGTLPLNQAVNVAWEYSFNGTTWTPITTAVAAVAKGMVSIDFAAALGGDWSKVSALQVRANGSVTSGTGLSAQMQAQFFRAWLALTATRNYPE